MESGFHINIYFANKRVTEVLQEKSGEYHPLVYLSKKLLPREQNIATVEKECYAIVWAVQRLQKYLYGREFIIETDHRALQWLKTMKSQNPRLLRWSLVLQEYRFTVKHIPGANNKMADLLSRSTLVLSTLSVIYLQWTLVNEWGRM